MDNVNPIQLLKYLGATVMFLYLLRYCIRAIQLYGFTKRLKSHLDLAQKENKDTGNEEYIQFSIPIDELAKGFGYNVDEKFLLLSATTQFANLTYAIFIFGYITIATLIAYFLLGISFKLIFFAIISLLFLLLIF